VPCHGTLCCRVGRTDSHGRSCAARWQTVDIRGQRLYLDCRGAGSPTVLLEAGAGDFSVVWELVQSRVRAVTRVCSYDRGGYAWSDPGSRPRTYAQLALELRTALDRAGETPPFVLVGQSYGGLVVRGFAKRYATDVVGMVLVDAVHEDESVVYGGAPHRLRDQAQGRPAPAPRIALDTQMLRMARDSSAAVDTEPLPSPLDRLPKDAQRVWRWAEQQPVYRMAWAAEMDWSPEELARMREERLVNRSSLGTIPLIVLARTAGGYQTGMTISADSLEKERRSFAADLARLSRRGRVIFAKAAGHNIHIEDPNLVSTAIREVVASARKPTP
jgi:pimeloyl-ACP methyl ester carboxylesterase